MKRAMEILDDLRSQSNYQTLFEDVSGYLHVEEGCALFALALGGPGQGEVTEIGSFHGRSTCFLAFGVKLRGEGIVYAVDHFLGSPEHQEGGNNQDDDLVQYGTMLPRFKANLRRHELDEFVRPILSASLPAAGKWDGSPIRLLFIDGDHSYKATKADFEAWNPYLAPDGLVAFHDVGDSWPGVTRFFEETTADGSGWVLKLAVGSLRVVQRTT